MADAPVPAAPPVAGPPAAAANPAPPEAAPPAPVEARLSGREALAIFQDLEAAPDPKASSSAAPAAPASSAPATAGKPDASPAATAAPSGDPPKADAPASQPNEPGKGDSPNSAAFRKLAEGQAQLRRERQALESLKSEAQGIVDWFKAVQADPTKLAEKLGADIFERGARAAAGAPPKAPDPNDRVTALEQRLNDEQKQRQDEAIRNQVAQSHQIVRGMLEKAGGDDVAAVLAFGKQNEVFDSFSLYLKNEGIQVQNGRYFARDGTPLAQDFEQQLVLVIGKEVNKGLVEEFGPLVEKVPQFRSRFAPAPAAAPAATTAAPPQASTSPAREAPAPATLTSRHGNDAAPSVSNGRRKTVAEVDEDIVSQYFGA